MKDFLRNELNIGDRVVFMTVQYRYLQIGTILRMGSSKLTIEGRDTDGKTKGTYIQFPYQVMKLPDDEVAK